MPITKKPTPSRALAWFRVEIWEKKIIILQSIACRFNPANMQEGTFISEGKTNLGKPTDSGPWCRVQKYCQLGELPWCHIPSSRRPSVSHLQWNNVQFGTHILQILLAISAEQPCVYFHLLKCMQDWALHQLTALRTRRGSVDELAVSGHCEL